MIFDELSKMYWTAQSSICFSIVQICLSFVISKSKFFRDVSTFLSKLDAPKRVLNLEPRWKAIGLWSFVSWHVFWPLLDVVTSAKCHFDRFSFSAVVVMGFIIDWTSWAGFWTRPFQICECLPQSSFRIPKQPYARIAVPTNPCAKFACSMVMVAKKLVDPAATCTGSSRLWLRVLFLDIAQEYIRFNYARFATIRIVLLLLFQTLFMARFSWVSKFPQWRQHKRAMAACFMLLTTFCKAIRGARVCVHTWTHCDTVCMHFDTVCMLCGHC